MLNVNNKEEELRQEIEQIDCEIAVLEKNIGMVRQTCGATDARGLISLGRFLESIPVMQERIDKLNNMKRTILASLKAMFGSQTTAVEAQCE